MSKETRNEIVSQIEVLTKTIEESQTRLAELNTALKVVKKEVELKIGDYGVIEHGMTSNDDTRIVCMDSDDLFIMSPCGRVNTAATLKSKHQPCTYKWYGNIFDRMNQAGKGGVIIAMTAKEAREHLNKASYGEGYTLSDSVDEKIEAAMEARGE